MELLGIRGKRVNIKQNGPWKRELRACPTADAEHDKERISQESKYERETAKQRMTLLEEWLNCRCNKGIGGLTDK